MDARDMVQYLTPRIRVDDMPLIIDALHEAAKDRRNFDDTLGKHDPEQLRKNSRNRADAYDRIAMELSA